jgi:hypothetical protein
MTNHEIPLPMRGDEKNRRSCLAMRLVSLFAEPESICTY